MTVMASGWKRVRGEENGKAPGSLKYVHSFHFEAAKAIRPIRKDLSSIRSSLRRIAQKHQK